MKRSQALLALVVMVWLSLFLFACNEDDSTPDGDTDFTEDAEAIDGDLEAEQEEIQPNPNDELAKLTIHPYIQRVSEREITIAWETDLEASSRVEITPPEGDPFEVRGETFKIEIRDDLDLVRMDAPEGFQHVVVVKELEPSTNYDYRVVSLEEASESYNVHTAPAPGEPLRFVAYGDNRTNPDIHAEVADAIAAQTPDLVLNTGDLVETGFALDEWLEFFEAATYASSAPTLPAVGNHEAFGGFSLFAGYFSSFFENMNMDVPLATTYRYGGLWILVLNSQLNIEDGTDLRKFAEEKLKEADNDPGIEFRFVMHHIPPYTWSNHSSEDFVSLEGREQLHALYKKHKVMAVLNGHNHCYEHFEREGIHYLVLGGGGAPLYSADSNAIEEERPFRVMGKKANHYALFESRQDGFQVSIKEIPGDLEIENFLIHKP